MVDTLLRAWYNTLWAVTRYTLLSPTSPMVWLENSPQCFWEDTCGSAGPKLVGWFITSEGNHQEHQ